MAIKRITAANENLTNGRDRVEAQHYWAESHGKLVANNAILKRYHHYFSVPEAYEHEPKPTFIGISMFWRDDPLAIPGPPDPNRFFPVRGDDEHVFDRTIRWPIDDQHGDILGEEHVIVDGPPVLGIADAIVLCNQVDNSVFVIESGKTRKGQAKAALKRLQQAGVHPLGVILTKIDAYHDLYGYHSYYYQYASAEPAAARKEVTGA